MESTFSVSSRVPAGSATFTSTGALVPRRVGVRKTSLPRYLHRELHGAAHALRVEVVINADERPELLGVRRKTENDLAVGMGAQPVVELPLPELDRRLHARLAETQGIVLLAAKLDAHRRIAAA